MARSKKGGKAYFWDRLVGALAILLDGLGVAMGGFMVHAGLTDPRLFKLDQPKIMGGLGLFVVALGLVHLIVHVGVFASRRWAFVGAALLAGFTLAGESKSSGFMLVYAVLRLGSVFGPALR